MASWMKNGCTGLRGPVDAGGSAVDELGGWWWCWAVGGWTDNRGRARSGGVCGGRGEEGRQAARQVGGLGGRRGCKRERWREGDRRILDCPRVRSGVKAKETSTFTGNLVGIKR
jgi:hypothetical protein